MKPSEAIHKLEFMRNAYQKLIDEKVDEGRFAGNEVAGTWKAGTPLNEVYREQIDALNTAIAALREQERTRWCPVPSDDGEMPETGTLGDWNSGDWNKSNYNSGCFMTIEPTIPLFNKPSDWTRRDWRRSDARGILIQMPQEIVAVDWVMEENMSDAEKAEHPTYKTIGGYLKASRKPANKQAWWDGLSDGDKETVKALPNFDADIFYECTGIRV